MILFLLLELSRILTIEPLFFSRLVFSLDYFLVCLPILKNKLRPYDFEKYTNLKELLQLTLGCSHEFHMLI